jgi:hypothetical protein
MAPRPLAMGWHPDGVPGPAGTLEARADPKRTPYGPPDLLSTFTYLTDVDETTPAFAVIPKSRRIANIQELKEALGDECVLYLYYYILLPFLYSTRYSTCPEPVLANGRFFSGSQ